MSKPKHKDEQLINRCVQVEIRAEDGIEGRIVGYPIVFEQETVIHDWWEDYREIIDRHALDNTDLSDVRLFMNHDTNMVTLARSKNGNGTMTLTIDDHGLRMEADLDIEGNSEAKNLYSAVKRGDMDGMSFMFRVRKQEWSDLDKQSELPLKRIKDISIVHEVSVVNFPAYKQSEVSARSEQSEETDDAYRSYVEAKKLLEEASDSALELAKLKARAMCI